MGQLQVPICSLPCEQVTQSAPASLVKPPPQVQATYVWKALHSCLTMLFMFALHVCRIVHGTLNALCFFADCEHRDGSMGLPAS